MRHVGTVENACIREHPKWVVVHEDIARHYGAIGMIISKLPALKRPGQDLGDVASPYVHCRQLRARVHTAGDTSTTGTSIRRSGVDGHESWPQVYSRKGVVDDANRTATDRSVAVESTCLCSIETSSAHKECKRSPPHVARQHLFVRLRIITYESNTYVIVCVARTRVSGIAIDLTQNCWGRSIATINEHHE